MTLAELANPFELKFTVIQPADSAAVDQLKMKPLEYRPQPPKKGARGPRDTTGKDRSGKPKEKRKPNEGRAGDEVGRRSFVPAGRWMPSKRDEKPNGVVTNARCQLSKWMFESNGIHHVPNAVHTLATWWNALFGGPGGALSVRRRRTVRRRRSVVGTHLTNGTTIATSCGGDSPGLQKPPVEWRGGGYLYVRIPHRVGR